MYQLKPVHPGPLFEDTPPDASPQPLDIDRQEAYTVSNILCSRRRRGCVEYLADWEGYGPEEQCWVPANVILDPKLLQDIHSRLPHQPAPRSRL